MTAGTKVFAAGVALVVVLVAVFAPQAFSAMWSGQAKGAPPQLYALLPAVLAIGLALWLREVVVALCGGILLGVCISVGVASAPGAAVDLLVKVLIDADHMKVILFTLFIGAMVGAVQAGGGSAGIVAMVGRWAKTRRSTQLATWVLGMAVFFDDYASTLLVGTTMRPITDAYRISREKLAYIVDSTSAPIASIALVSSWIGYEVSTLGAAMKQANIPGEAYSVFVSGIPARFYPILALYLVALSAWTQRDFGPMYDAEARALRGEGVLRPGATPLVEAGVDVETGDAPPRASIALVPVGVLVATVLTILGIQGADASYDALMYGAALASVVALVLVVASRALTLQSGISALVGGMRAMSMAVVVLSLAWCIGKVMGDLGAGKAVAQLVGDALPPWSLPTVTFLLAALMALSTGTSWGTMAILFPIVIPVVGAHAQSADFASILVGTSSAVLAGAVFGDHCSPISDTTVLSSVASASDHMDHTKTQLPYALLVGAVSILFGTLPAGLGAPPLLALALGFAVLTAVFLKTSRRLPQPAPSGEAPGASSASVGKSGIVSP